MCMYIVKHYLGGDLFSRLEKKGKYIELEAKSVMKKIIEAIKYLHSNNVIHR